MKLDRSLKIMKAAALRSSRGLGRVRRLAQDPTTTEAALRNILIKTANAAEDAVYRWVAAEESGSDLMDRMLAALRKAEARKAAKKGR